MTTTRCKNGKYDLATKKCECNSGWYGDACDKKIPAGAGIEFVGDSLISFATSILPTVDYDIFPSDPALTEEAATDVTMPATEPLQGTEMANTRSLTTQGMPPLSSARSAPPTIEMDVQPSKNLKRDGTTQGAPRGKSIGY
jgi:hypothetical protein